MGLQDNATGRHGYRRGLVLGMTLAEIFMLVVFMLLLAMQLLRKKEEEERNRGRSAVEIRYEQLYRELVSKVGDATDVSRALIDENFRELTLLKDKNQSLEKEKTEALARAEAAEQEAVQIKANNEQLVERIAALRGMPACWRVESDSRPDEKKPAVSIFEVVLTENGVVTRDISRPDRTADKRKFPIQQMAFNKEQTIEEFEIAARPLHRYTYNQAQPCMHMVELFDCTDASSKARYQMLRNRVEKFFWTRINNSCPLKPSVQVPSQLSPTLIEPVLE